MRTNALLRALAIGAVAATLALATTTRAAEPTLAEAARVAGVRVGVLADRRSAAENELLDREFDVLVAHGLSWNVIHPEPDVWNFGPADQVFELAAVSGKSVTGMHFVWEQLVLDDAADWVLAIDDPDQLRTVLREHLRTIDARYAGRLEALTVVNEPLEITGGALHRNHFHRVLGPDYVAEAFRIARAEAPGVELILNENFTEYFPAKAAGLVDLVARLVDEGVPIDAVGLETHLLFGEPDWDLMRRTMKALGDLGVRVLVTELDAPVPVDLPDRLTVQADRTERVADSAVAPRRRRLELVSRDPGLTTGGGDPRRLGATLRVRNPQSGEEAVLDLPPDRWRVLPPTAGQAGYRYRGAPGDPCRGVLLRPGRNLEVNCRGEGIDFTLDEPAQGGLVAELRLDGAPLQCFAFGGTIARDLGNDGRRGGRFVARHASATPTCATGAAPASGDALLRHENAKRESGPDGFSTFRADLLAARRAGRKARAA